MIFTGKRANRPDYITLSKEFFQGKECSVEIKARVLYGEESKDIISQYIEFSKVYTEQVKKHGYTREAVLETIHICRNKDVLAEYLRSKESEVVSIMMALFDEEYIQQAYHSRLKREAAEEARAKAVKEVTESVTKEVTESVTKEVTLSTSKETAIKMLKSGKFSIEEIAEYVPKLSITDIMELKENLIETV